MTTDTTEKGLESLIVRAMTGRVDLLSPPYIATETSTPVAGGTGWILGDPKHYDRGACVDIVQLRGFLLVTQPKLIDALSLETDCPTRRQFLARLESEIRKRGVIDLLRKGVDHGPHHIELFYGTPSPGNEKAAERFARNRFSLTGQLAYSADEQRRALDLGLFGFPLRLSSLRTASPSRRWKTLSSNIGATGIRASRSSRSAVASFISPSMMPRFVFALRSRARAPGFCRSTRDTTTAPGTRRTRTG